MSKKRKILITITIIVITLITALCCGVGIVVGFINNGIYEFYGADYDSELHNKSDEDFKKVKDEFEFPCKSKAEGKSNDDEAFFMQTYTTFDEYRIYCVLETSEQNKIVDFMKNNLSKDRTRVILFYQQQEWENYVTEDGLEGARKLEEKLLRSEVLNINIISNPFTRITLELKKLGIE